LRKPYYWLDFIEEFSHHYIAITICHLAGRKAIDTAIASQELQVQHQAEKEFRIIPVVNENCVCGFKP
jgi:hypothetical protein